MEIREFRDLKIWKLGMSIVIDVYRLTKSFPKDELFGLTSQMRRAAVSIPSNIAEGFNRYHTKEFIRYLYIALGSCAELETQLEIASDLAYLENETKLDLLENINHETRMLRNLIKKL